MTGVGLGFFLVSCSAAMFGAEDGLFPASFFVVGDGRNGGNGKWIMVLVDGDQGYIGGGGLEAGLVDGVFSGYLDADFHAGAVGIVDHRAEDDMLSNIYWIMEGNGVDGGSDGGPLAVSHGCHRGDHIYPGEDDAAEDGAMGVSVVGHDEITGFDAALGGRLGTGFMHDLILSKGLAFWDNIAGRNKKQVAMKKPR